MRDDGREQLSLSDLRKRRCLAIIVDSEPRRPVALDLLAAVRIAKLGEKGAFPRSTPYTQRSRAAVLFNAG
jgi:hypothetical protein